MKRRKIRTSKVIITFGDWSVTNYGIEHNCDFAYHIAKSRLWDEIALDHGWLQHMAEKEWVNMDDFSQAFRAAQEWHRKPNKKEAKDASNL